MFKTAACCGLVLSIVVMVLCASSDAEARRWRYHYYGRSFDQDAAANRSQERGSNASGAGSFRAQGTGFGPMMDQLIRGCSQEAVELKNWPFDYLAQIVGTDESQLNALQQMQTTVVDASGILASRCAKDVPAAMSARFDALKQGLEAFMSALDAVRPAVGTFYTTLNDEQKARLVALYLSNNSNGEKSPEFQFRRANNSAYPAALSPQQGTTCQNWAGALRSWPTHQIESTIAASDVQRAALYDLTASIFRAAGALVASCPTETSFTPLGQIEAKRKRVDALAQAIGTIRPVFDRFADMLNDDQKARLARTVSSTQPSTPSPPPLRRRNDNDDD